MLYHGGGCTDGFAAAFAAWCALGDTAEYVAMSYSDDPLRDVIYEDRDVYILDFSVPKHDMWQLIDKTRKLVWLDHHKSAFEMWVPGTFVKGDKFKDVNAPDELYIYLDDNKSGAMLAWEYFHKDEPIPVLIKRIDDRDRWVFQYRDSRALHAGLQLRKPWRFEDWNYLEPMNSSYWQGAYGEVVREGEIALQVYDQQIQASVAKAARCKVPNYNVPDNIVTEHALEWELRDEQAREEMAQFHAPPGLAVNSPIHQSEIGNELAKASGTYGLVWYLDSSSKRANCSLRSIGDFDVSAIAKAFGGGGHTNAAGMNIDMLTLMGWLNADK